MNKKSRLVRADKISDEIGQIEHELVKAMSNTRADICHLLLSVERRLEEPTARLAALYNRLKPYEIRWKGNIHGERK